MAQDLTISIICEGPTDDIVLRNVITSFTGNKDILFTTLQPRPGDDGNWDKVLKYCASDDFKGSFANPDNYVVIQIDTDFLIGDSCPEQFRIPLIDQMEPIPVLDEMRKHLINQMGQAHFDLFSSRIIFAIAVAQLECWFLAIYYPDNKKKAGKVVSCIDNLNAPLFQAEKFYIDAKDLGHYRTICRHFKKKADLLKYSTPNDSFRAFVNELDTKIPKEPVAE